MNQQCYKLLSNLKSLSSIWRGIIFVFIIGMMMTGSVVLAEDTIDFNVTVWLSYNDYKKVTRSFSVTADGSTGGSCHNSVTKQFSLNIPFQQNITLNQSASASKNCDGKSVKYRQEGGAWAAFANGQILFDYEGLLEFNIYSRNNRYHFKCRTCIVTGKATFFGEAMNQQRKEGTYSFSLPIIKGKQEVKRIAIPASQFADGVVRDLECQADTDKPSEVIPSCEREGNELVIYAEIINISLSAIDYIEKCVSKFSNYFGSKEDSAFLCGEDNYYCQMTTGGTSGDIIAIAVHQSERDVFWYYWNGWASLDLSYCD